MKRGWSVGTTTEAERFPVALEHHGQAGNTALTPKRPILSKLTALMRINPTTLDSRSQRRITLANAREIGKKFSGCGIRRCTECSV